MTIDCPYSVDKKQGLRLYKLCSINKQMCPFIRLCNHVLPGTTTVVHTERALKCELRLSQD